MDHDSLPRAEERTVAALPAVRNGTVDEIVGAVLWGSAPAGPSSSWDTH